MKKKRPRTSEEWAAAWKADEISLEDALIGHFKLVGLWPVNQEIFTPLWIVIGFANLGGMDTMIPLGDGKEESVRDIIEHFRLSEFLE